VKGLVQGGFQELYGHSDRTPEFLCGDASTPALLAVWVFRSAKIVASYTRKLEAVKSASTKYRVKGLNTYLKVIFQFLFFINVQKKCTILFFLCHYGLLCVD
jgi:hypothetical protein